MKEFKCSVAQKGFYAGPVFFIHSGFKNTDVKTSDIKGELSKLQKTTSALKKKLLENHVSGTNTEIRDTVLSILEDETFIDRIETNIRQLSLNASSAVLKASDELTEALGSVESAYIRSRCDDIRGVANKLVSVLDGNSECPEECSAICAQEISPAQLSSIDEALIGGMLTDKGSPNSHAAILAGNINIPYLYGNSEAVTEAVKADFIIIDSETGTVTVNPDEEIRTAAMQRMEQITSARMAEELAQQENAAQCRTKIFANIEGPQDIEALLESGADGVGLFRTEFLFLGAKSTPTEDEQYEAYCRVLEAMGNREVIIRTMDIGSDKKVSWLSIPDESNPALGLRGVRVSLERKDLFRTQLRALLRAGVKGNLKVMFPMVASSWEIDEIKERINEASGELKAEGIEYRVPELGIMIETPAAAVCAEEFAGRVSFFSIGTNDLTQYTLALDREAQGLDRYFVPHHEAVFRLIEMTVKGGHAHGAEIGVCGQLAADAEAIQRLIAAGVDELSVPVRRVKATRKLAAEAEKLIEEQRLKEADAACLSVAAVADGELIPMHEIPDPAFSEGCLGECFGILPSNGSIYSPVSGTVISIAETGHAVTIRADSGEEILVHVGINTVSLGKKAFSHHVSVGEHIEKDRLMMEADLDMITSSGLSPVIVIIKLSTDSE